MEPVLEQRFSDYQRRLGKQITKAALALSKVEEVSSLLKTSIQQQSKNVEDVETRLLPASQEIKAFAKQTEMVAEELEQEAEKSSKRTCLCLIVGSVAVVLVGLGVGLYFVFK